ncbi:MAG: hypothetical protein Q9183_006390 [Haloplaca sp. 2 TL-2023]
MAARLSWLEKLKQKNLQAICRAIGVNSTGTKATLRENIHHGLNPDAFTAQRKTNKQDAYSIISIDMGIRNLAYCHLSLPDSWPDAPSPEPQIPTLKAWSRIDVSTQTHLTPPSLNPKTRQLSEDHLEKKSESFDPPTYAAHAYNLLTKTILPHEPTHILIERQRYRSIRSTAVQEWTLRVNMFEAMLYSTLHTLSQRGHYNGLVVPMSPNKVSRYWLPYDQRAARSDKHTKRQKMEVARDMVTNGWGVHFESQDPGVPMGTVPEKMSRTKKDFLTKSGKARMGGKFDDLADSLLQGLAFVKWDENKRAALEKGEAVLQDLMSKQEG